MIRIQQGEKLLPVAIGPGVLVSSTSNGRDNQAGHRLSSITMHCQLLCLN